MLLLLIDFAVDLLGNCECVPELEVAPIREEHWNLHSKIFEYCVMMKEGLKCTSILFLATVFQTRSAQNKLP